MTGLIVTVLVAGILVPASRPARLESGSIVVPLVPFVSRIAQTIEVDGAGGAVDVRRGGAHVVLHFGTDARKGADGTVYVRLATVVRGLGGTVRYDGVRKVASVEMPGPIPIVTPTPYDGPNVTASPRSVPTLQPTASPRPTLTGIPEPRRTPVPAVPSLP